MADEKKCTRCGICCYLAIPDNGQRFFTPFHCPYLDSETKLCTVYECRFDVAPWEVPLPDVIKAKQLPNGCPYVEDDPNYKGPVSDYRLSPLVTRRVNEVLRRGPVRIENHGRRLVYKYGGCEMILDQAWTGQTTTYSLPKLTELI